MPELRTDPPAAVTRQPVDAHHASWVGGDQFVELRTGPPAGTRGQVDAHYAGRVGGDQFVVNVYGMTAPAPQRLDDEHWNRAVALPYGLLERFRLAMRLVCVHTAVGEHDEDECLPAEYRRRVDRVPPTC